ncbi:MAG TPA: hypothetical protein VG409_16470, partial [Actinomycetota bacterium]|nr:hypothetical protein [Actinomycetota bacterium]
MELGVAEGAVDVGGAADLVDLEPAADSGDLQVDQVGSAAPEARPGQRAGVDLQGLQGAGAVEAVGGRDGGRPRPNLQGDLLELGGVVAPAGGDGRVDGGGGSAGGLGGERGGGGVQADGRPVARPPARGQLGRGMA